MTPLAFKPLGPGQTVYVVAERITHLRAYDANGWHGTRLVLDTGAELSVGEWPEDVAARLAALPKPGAAE